MKRFAAVISTCFLLSCSGAVTNVTAPTFDFKTVKQWQVGYAIRSDTIEEVKSASGGTVVLLDNNENNSTNMGKYVIIEHIKILVEGQQSTRISYYSLYAMLGDIIISRGQVINGNTVVGHTGPTGKLKDFESGATLLFAVFMESENAELDKEWGAPIKAYGKYWYDAKKVLGISF